MARAGDEYLSRMKEKKKEETASRRERERRRHKLLVDQSKASAAAEAKKRQDDLLATLAARSQQETRVAERLRTLEGGACCGPSILSCTSAALHLRRVSKSISLESSE